MRSGEVAKWQRGRRGGFTLPELLITTSLLALIIGAVVAAVVGGFRVWGRAKAYGANEQASLIAFEQLRRDLHNAAPFALLPFAGAYDELSFALVSRDARTPRAPREIGRHGYYIDDRRNLLCRSFAPYRLTREVRLKDRCEVALEHVQRLRFEYFGASGQTGEAVWTQSWDAATPPIAVKVSLVLQDGREPSTSHSMVMFLPAVGTRPDVDES